MLALVVCGGLLAACGTSADNAGTSGTGTTVTSQDTSSVSAAATSGTSTGTSNPTNSSATTPSTSGTGSTATAAGCEPTGSTTEVKVNFPDRLSSLVGKEIRVGAQACADRVVIELQPGSAPTAADFPGYWVRYSHAPPRYSPSDEPATVKGAAVLLISMGSWMHAMDDPTSAGPNDITPTDTTMVKHLLLLENFEGMATWAVGLDAEHPYVVSTLQDPPRLVVDIEAASPA